jgi:hypothetical protein
MPFALAVLLVIKDSTVNLTVMPSTAIIASLTVWGIYDVPPALQKELQAGRSTQIQSSMGTDGQLVLCGSKWHQVTSYM